MDTFDLDFYDPRTDKGLKGEPGIQVVLGYSTEGRSRMPIVSSECCNPVELEREVARLKLLLDKVLDRGKRWFAQFDRS